MAYHDIFIENLTQTIKKWRTPLDFSHTPGGTRTPGWEPLLQKIIVQILATNVNNNMHF